MLSTFSIRALYIVIIVHLSSLSGDFKICVMSESGPHGFSEGFMLVWVELGRV